MQLKPSLYWLSIYQYLFSPQMAVQLKWSPPVTVHGDTGKNSWRSSHGARQQLSKEAISGLGENLTNHTIDCVEKCNGKWKMINLQTIFLQYDKNNVRPTSC